MSPFSKPIKRTIVFRSRFGPFVDKVLRLYPLGGSRKWNTIWSGSLDDPNMTTLQDGIWWTNCLSLHHSLSGQVVVSALLCLWFAHAIFSDLSPVGMHPPCPALSSLLNPGTKSLRGCPFASFLPSFIFPCINLNSLYQFISSSSSPPYCFS